MNRERWQKLEEVYHAALELPEPERLEFVRERCSGDEDLCQEVESLLSREKVVGSFLENPIAQADDDEQESDRMIGQSIAHYTITARLGQGGMGEVFRATDNKLRREVALKILPDSFTDDAQRMARFTREARVLASISHPNIGAIHGIEEQDGVRALVLELIEGEDLSEVIARGPIPLEKALQIALQITLALEAAHEKGIIHRDLKPANVKITPEGTVKVLDFGLAKALENDPVASPDLTNSPTLSVEGTKAGFILGTAAYMSPEQARGQAVDQRSDIWAFGVVLFEMLSGRSSFAGGNIADLLAAVIKEEPDWKLLPPEIPLTVQKVLRRCLTKDVRKRLQHIGDARLELEDALAESDLEKPVEATAVQPARSGWLWVTALLIGALLGTMGTWSWVSNELPEASPAMRLSIPAPIFLDAALSRDGRQLAFSGSARGERNLYVRQLRLNSNRVLDTKFTVSSLAWSPDGSRLAISGGGELGWIRLADGVYQKLCDLQAKGISWNDRGTLIFGTAGNLLYRVSSTGGIPEPLTTLDSERGDAEHSFPNFLPDQDHFIFLVRTKNKDETGIYLGSLGSAETRMLVQTEVKATFAPPHHLLFVANGALYSQRLDLQELVLEGEPFQIADEVGMFPATGEANFANSEANTLVLGAYGVFQTAYDLVWFSRSGEQIGQVAQSVNAVTINLSGDGSRLAMSRSEDGQREIWITELSRGATSPIGKEPGSEFDPQWSPDRSRIAFSSDRFGNSSLFVKSLGQGPAELLHRSDVGLTMCDWSSDGRYILYQAERARLIALPLFGDRQPFTVLETAGTKDQAQFSPDNRWIAYNADQSGQFQIYVTSFPSGGEELPVSTNGGVQPRWSADGRELFFLDPESRLMVADVKEVGDGLEFGIPRVLFQSRLEVLAHIEMYDISPDGQSFIMAVPAEGSMAPLRVIVNWTSLLDE